MTKHVRLTIWKRGHLEASITVGFGMTFRIVPFRVAQDLSMPRSGVSG